MKIIIILIYNVYYYCAYLIRSWINQRSSLFNFLTKLAHHLNGNYKFMLLHESKHWSEFDYTHISFNTERFDDIVNNYHIICVYIRL